jgi:hypothetical protein
VVEGRIWRSTTARLLKPVRLEADIAPMEKPRQQDLRDETIAWRRVRGALAALAVRTGCSLEESPMPEIREVARELRDRQEQPPARPS